MAINIIDSFYIGSSIPIDNRIVATNSTVRNNIQYVYDGLKVFQTDTRQTWIWNAGTSTWDLEGNSSISGSGVSGYIASWTSSNGLLNSNIYASGSSVGINNSNPLSVLQINGANQPLSIDNGLGGSVIGYNWYYNGGDQVFNSSYGSSKVLLDNSGAILFNNRNSGGSFRNTLSLNSSGYNILVSPLNGNFISGSVSFSPNLSPYSSTFGDLVFVDGSFRTNSSVSKSFKYLNHGFQTIPTPYNIQSSDHEIVIQYASLYSTLTVNLPPATPLNVGREIVLSLEAANLSAYFLIGGTSLIKDSNGNNTNPVIYVGQTIRLLSYGTFWKTMEYVKNSSDESWKTIGGGGFFQNGQPVPNFNYSCSNSSAPIQVRITRTNRVAIRGFVILDNPWVPSNILFALPIGYRPVHDVFIVTSSLGNIALRSNGYLEIYGYSGLTNIVIPEMEISLD